MRPERLRRAGLSPNRDARDIRRATHFGVRRTTYFAIRRTRQVGERGVREGRSEGSGRWDLEELSILEGEPDQRVAAVDLEFGADVESVSLDGAHAYEQF